VRGPLGADLRGPFLLQGGAAVQPEQVGQRHVRPRPDRLPGPLRQQARRDQPAHALARKMHRDVCHTKALRVWYVRSRPPGGMPTMFPSRVIPGAKWTRSQPRPRSFRCCPVPSHVSQAFRT
jgi:hypothetical protein